MRGIDDHLVWGADGPAWACFEVEPFGYPHRSVRDARDIHARTVAALLALPAQSLILSVARALSRGELEQRIRGNSAAVASGWVGMARRTANRLAAESVYERMWFLAMRLPDAGGGRRRLTDRIRTAMSEVGSAFGTPPPPPGDRRVAVAMSQADSLAEQLSQHVGLRRLGAGQVRWLYERAVLRGLVDPPLPCRDAAGTGQPSVVRLDRDAVYFEGGRRTDADRPRHWRYLTVEHPDHGTSHQAFACLAEIPAVWTFPYGSGEWLWHLDDQLPFPVDWAVRIETVDNQTARRRALRAKRNPVESMIEIVREHSANVKRWRDGEMALRWAAAGMESAHSQFRRVKGFRQLPQLAAALEAATADEPGLLDLRVTA